MTTTTETPRWFTSSYSDNGGACVEVAANLAASHGVVPVRDSKVPAGSTLRLSPTAFTSFVESVKGGRLGA
ncbi:DUF397 domain-containing protein [Streptomyces sp. TRM76323]|uniref:DUF397 domain-containing protein n=1 Tax=Streptomyces tamarix TaxID=3078565 RepID=A0ABU3QLM4_9ACTN|nr:DUF397 domain-containing protein [Streptomyces tamarix]MDT9683669.1 DUF397 domain-containing protein [Streptomyces tamarix]